MNLSQDEINALMGGNPSDDAAADSEPADIMSPEAIAAMLDASAGDAGSAPADSSSDTDIMSPEAIAAMLDG
jgi:hypothetical protein